MLIIDPNITRMSELVQRPSAQNGYTDKIFIHLASTNKQRTTMAIVTYQALLGRLDSIYIAVELLVTSCGAILTHGIPPQALSQICVYEWLCITNTTFCKSPCVVTTACHVAYYLGCSRKLPTHLVNKL